ncbi:MAG: FHA domain-containing protein [Bacteroidetes bacterium]|uniref:FHA domain-containing protein n=1 Tax=Candidatus Cryptobacteroides merdavium TaxID=2840769 RepID=A0A9D9ECV0_9BACT|nr:FHA domain-containing protein [Candidatus Cryptobacteroides merdavium]
MDTKKKIVKALLLLGSLIPACICADARDAEVAGIRFCDRSYSYGMGNDTIRVYFNVLGDDGKRISDLTPERFDEMLYFYEDGTEIQDRSVRRISTGIRIPREYTFSLLLDRSIPSEGKRQILDAVRNFMEAAPDTSVFVSFYGDEVTNSILASEENFGIVEAIYLDTTAIDGKAFYSGVYSKLAEFSPEDAEYIGEVKSAEYSQNRLISARAAENPGKNVLMVFAEGSRRPDDEQLDYIKVSDYQSRHSAFLPKVYAFYYTADGEDTSIDITLDGITQPKDSANNVIQDLRGRYLPSSDMSEVLSSFEQIIEDATFDYELAYSAVPDKIYSGNVEYSAKWGRIPAGEATFTIGSAERPWPEHRQSTTSIFVELFVAILVTVLTFAFFFLIMKVAVPYVRFLTFKSRYYKKYQPEENVQVRICHYCKQELKPGQVIVTKCSHWMHRHCWEENGYKCAEFGQNCKTGIQDHVEWRELFKWNTVKDCSQTIAGILAGLVSWIIYEVCGRGGFTGLSRAIVGFVLDGSGSHASFIDDCVARTSSFLMIGLLLGFFISLVFRYKDDVRNKDWKIWFKIVGLSCLTALIGMAAFAIGADLFCLILSWSGKTYIPWYCSLPAYMLFSISVSLALTIKSTIPVRSALFGGLCSSLIGFLVLYFTRFTGSGYEWLNMLLAFIIYGGGLGASLITVRMLAEKYFLVVQNGVKAGMRIPIHKWMNAVGGGNKVSIGMTGECEIQMNWEKGNKVAKEHAQLFIDHEKGLPVIKPLATGVLYNSRAELPVNRTAVLSNGDTFKIGDTIFKYEEN